jgi:hypothetical protein
MDARSCAKPCLIRRRIGHPSCSSKHLVRFTERSDPVVRPREPSQLAQRSCLPCVSYAHAYRNLRFTAAGHALAIDAERLELFCLQCRDYVFLSQFDAAVMASP